ncbi:MAG: hypothetical protein L0H79_05315 [Intrasporangium sp.]|uniref:hypothetical protein n=1 Tax=Intrasporangium sp. TaxID=1925024 RepID=UPI0026470A89|nr:hypothetical protein [Intrasporangium sp.]MDN5795155.1 hypothetical protein [Intrasporangium sp.]
MCDNGSCPANRADPDDLRGAAGDLTLLDDTLARVADRPLEWDQSVAPGLERQALGGTTRSFLGHVLFLGEIEVPSRTRSSGSVWLDSADALAAVCIACGVCEHDLEVLVHPQARVEDLARAVDWIRVGLPTEPLIDEIEDRDPGSRVDPPARPDLARLLSSGLAGPDLGADPGGHLADQPGLIEATAWFDRPGTPDIPLLEQALAFVADHPLQWDQRTWQSDGLFGPVRCVAGHALVMCGYTVDPLDPDRATSPDGIADTAWRHATTRLGLCDDDAGELFALGDLESLSELVRDIEVESADPLHRSLTGSGPTT